MSPCWARLNDRGVLCCSRLVQLALGDEARRLHGVFSAVNETLFRGKHVKSDSCRARYLLKPVVRLWNASVVLPV